MLIREHTMYVIWICSGWTDSELHRGFLVSTLLAMKAGCRSLYDRVAKASIEEPGSIKCDCDGCSGVSAGTTEYGFDYEILQVTAI